MQTPLLTKAFEANAAIAARTLVALRNDGTVETASGTNSAIIGVSTDVDTPAGGTCDVICLGIATVRSSAAFGAGDILTSDAFGRGVVTTSNGHRIAGLALQAATSSDEEIAVLVTPNIR